MTTNRYLAVTGGIGGAKLALGLSKLLGEHELAFVVNTGDDFEHLGLHISPDIDTLVYTLAEKNNRETGWGRHNESWHFMSALAALGGETWFKLGDKDLAMNVERSQRLRAGGSLSQVTSSLASSLGVNYPVLPMTDDRVRTLIHTENGRQEFQHYFVRDRCEPAVTGFEYSAAASARLNSEIRKWLLAEDLAGVIVCPSNPFISIDPILSVPGMREQLRESKVPVIAVSPIVGGNSLKGPLAKMMRELSIPTRASWIAGHYGDFLDGVILDPVDESQIPEVNALGVAAMTTKSVMTTLDDRVRLAKRSLEFIASLRDSAWAQASQGE